MRIVPVYSRQIPADSPPAKQGASDPISGLTGLCVYLFYPNLFPSKSASFPQKNNQNAPLSKPVIAIAVHMMFTLRWLLFLQFRVKVEDDKHFSVRVFERSGIQIFVW